MNDWEGWCDDQRNDEIVWMMLTMEKSCVNNGKVVVNSGKVVVNN